MLEYSLDVSARLCMSCLWAEDFVPTRPRLLRHEATHRIWCVCNSAAHRAFSMLLAVLTAVAGLLLTGICKWPTILYRGFVSSAQI